MKILVLGSSGMAGHMVAGYLRECGYEVTGVARHASKDTNIIADVCEEEKVRTLLANGCYDVVVNCIGVLNQAVDHDLARGIYLNAYFPHRLAQLLKDMKVKLIHLSTDCVFAGNTGPYTEQSCCDGTSAYDRTKALGEVIDDKNLTFRMSIIGPDPNEAGIGLFHWFMKQEQPIRGYTKAIWTGVTTLTLAKAIEGAIKENLCGLYHLVNNQSISKYELCQLFNRSFKEGKLTIHPYDQVVLDKTLLNTRSDFSFVVPSYEQMIQEMKVWILTHKTDYKVYIQRI